METTPAVPGSADQSRRPKRLESAPSASIGAAEAVTRSSATLSAWPGFQLVQHAVDYWIDTWQRSVLFLDVLRQRGNNHLERAAEQVPHVLHFEFELVMSGRELERPVNYGLVHILPPAGGKPDPRKRPFIVFDPRAGHGPGIGGMKPDSEIGVALAAGHPCYFVGFTPNPVPGQTVEDVCRAEARFVEKVVELHPEAEDKPCLIGNCQAGWQLMMMSAIRPDLAGPIMLAGSPLSYWAGVRGKNPLRYLGGTLGGTWLTSLAGDLGNGVFDGAHLVNNFESLDPANTLWQKSYNLYSKIDTEAPRFLEFEKWWGTPVLLNAAEMQYIADELFVGNKLASGEIYTSNGQRVDLRNIKSPIIVFGSWGDNITPPQQALGWILDLYDSDEEIVANGQTIVYTLHQTIGHLGIFVSAKVATKEHEEFTQTMDLIDVLPPGLYEAVMTKKGASTVHPELATGDYVVRFEARTLNHIRALGGNDAEDELRFATAARVSALNQGLYRTFLSPFVRMMSNEETAERLRQLHPHRARFEAFTDRNPLAQVVMPLADSIRANRHLVGDDNPFRALEVEISRQIVDALDRFRDTRDRLTEALFMNVYGSPVLQAMVGLRSDDAIARQRIGRDVAREAATAKMNEEVRARLAQGGLLEATIRAMIFIALGRLVKGADERGFAVLREVRASRPESRRMPLAKFKELARDQYLILRHDEERAVAAIPQLLPADAAERTAALGILRRIVAAGGEPPAEVQRRLSQIETLFEASPVAEAPVSWTVTEASGAPMSRRKPEIRAAREKRGEKARA
jgi:hypothetical protein